MQLRQFEYFVEVADTLSFTTAAARLHVVQSGVSAAIRALERELDVELFERTTQGLRLTAAGRLFLPEARTTLDAVQHAADTIARARRGLSGLVRLGVLSSVELVDVPAVVGDFHRSHPGVEVRVRNGATAIFLEALAHREIDLAFVSPTGAIPEGVRLHLLGSAPFVAVLPRAHPLASRRQLRLEELAGEQFIDSPPGFGNRDQLDALFAGQGITRTVVTEVPDVATTAAYVRYGLGVAVVPDVTALAGQDVAVVPFAGEVPPWKLSLAWVERAHPNLAVQALVDAFSLHPPASAEGGS